MQERQKDLCQAGASGELAEVWLSPITGLRPEVPLPLCSLLRALPALPAVSVRWKWKTRRAVVPPTAKPYRNTPG